jgi:hypothetical protein
MIFSHKDSEISKLKEQNKNLFEECEKLKKQLLKNEGDKNKINLCIQCKEYFLVKFNNERSCLYHPGKIKYYSCRGCGGDEYYTCCDQCYKCSKGCKLSFHKTDENNNNNKINLNNLNII